MSSAPAKSTLSPANPEPAWDVAKLFPAQGHWSVPEYLSLNGNYFVEYTNGVIEVLSMPTELHQAIVAFLYEAILLFVRARSLGTIRFAPLRVRLDSGTFREPDLLFMLAKNDARRHNEFWDGADLVIEVVSDDDRRRDFETKREEYARAAIAEYWIVDPQKSEITVLKLAGDQYEVHGVFGRGDLADSPLLQGFTVAVTNVFDVK